MYLLREWWSNEGGLGWRGEYNVEKDAAVTLAVAVTGAIFDCRTHVNRCLVNLAVDFCSVCMGSFSRFCRRRAVTQPRASSESKAGKQEARPGHRAVAGV